MNTYYTDNIVNISYTSIRLIVSAISENKAREIFEMYIKDTKGNNAFYSGHINKDFTIKRLINGKVKEFFCEG